MKLIILLCCFAAVVYCHPYEDRINEQLTSELSNEENAFEDDNVKSSSKEEVIGFVNAITPPDETTPPDESEDNLDDENDRILSNDDIDLDPSENSDLIAPDERDEAVVVDGDILLNKQQAAIYRKEGWDGLISSQAWAKRRRWGRKIRYRVSKKIKGSVRSNLFASIREIQRKTCVRFKRIKRWKIKPHLYFKRGKGCLVRFLGRPLLGARRVFLKSNCAGGSRRMTPAHEIMHAMGRWHEQTRRDRNSYVTINDNTCKSQFKINKKAKTLGIRYDYFSSMHYSPWQCSKNGRPSMSFPPGINPNSVGQRSRLSNRDAQHIKAIHCPSMMARLVGGEGPYEGRVEVNSDDVWGTVCSNGFDMKDARVVCKYLGHPGVEKMYTTGNNVKYTTKNVPIWMSNLMCTGEEFSPFHCEQAPIASHDCSHNQDVAIKCSKAARLVGDSDNSGRLEIYHEGQWGSVCSHKFGYKEAMVACRMMGYTRAVRAFTADNQEFTTASENKVILSELKCDGKEDHLSSCDYEDDHFDCPGDSSVHLMCQ